LSAAFLAVYSFVQSYGFIASILLFGAFFNAWIAVFNLVPFGILDGFKVFQWNKLVWVVAFAASVVLTVVSYRFIF
jgi:Zn-dependent protease